MSFRIDPALAIGTVTLSIADMARSLAYYQQSIGLSVLSQAGGTATLGAGSTPLVHLREAPGARLVRRATGLYHFALRVPTRHDLAQVIQHFIDQRVPIDGASDHHVSEALYLSDPDGHGIEIYRDRPRAEWVDARGNFRMGTDPLDVAGILGELGGQAPAWGGLADGTDMGHMHLQVSDIAAAERFYMDVLGLDRMARMPSASFISAGGYHHHLGMNTWAGVGVPAPPEGAARLLGYELVLPSESALDAVVERVRAADLPIEQEGAGWAVSDPSWNRVVLRAA
jgi:catechol 2,3-dioxygenase